MILPRLLVCFADWLNWVHFIMLLRIQQNLLQVTTISMYQLSSNVAPELFWLTDLVPILRFFILILERTITGFAHVSPRRPIRLDGINNALIFNFEFIFWFHFGKLFESLLLNTKEVIWVTPRWIFRVWVAFFDNFQFFFLNAVIFVSLF
jgi:hypothetical protein